MKFRYLIIFVVVFLYLTGCSTSTKKNWVVYQGSEMSDLMNEMYAYNESIKQQVIDGTLNNSFPERFNHIHKAELTSPSDRDDVFEHYSAQFLDIQKALYQAPPANLISSYNAAINACIDCHSLKCVGPIPRIKKLLIEE